MAHSLQGRENEADLEDTINYDKDGKGASELAETLHNINLRLDKIVRNQKSIVKVVRLVEPETNCVPLNRGDLLRGVITITTCHTRQLLFSQTRLISIPSVLTTEPSPKLLHSTKCRNSLTLLNRP